MSNHLSARPRESGDEKIAGSEERGTLEGTADMERGRTTSKAAARERARERESERARARGRNDERARGRERLIEQARERERDRARPHLQRKLRLMLCGVGNWWQSRAHSASATDVMRLLRRERRVRARSKAGLAG